MSDLKSYRKLNGLLQEDLGKLLGVQQTTISKLESGFMQPGLELAIQIEDLTKGAVPVRSWVGKPTQDAA